MRREEGAKDERTDRKGGRTEWEVVFVCLSGHKAHSNYKTAISAMEVLYTASQPSSTDQILKHTVGEK